MKRAFVALAALALLVPAAHAATHIDLAAGQQWMEPQAADFNWPTDGYWNDHRDLRAYTPAVWRALKRHHARLNIHLRYERDFGPVPAGRTASRDVMPILRGARRHHIPFAVWLVVPYRDGYWATENNAPLMIRATRAYFRWAKRRRVDADGVLIDLEASLDDTRTVAHLRDDPTAVGAMLARNVGPVHQCAAAKEYRRLVDLIHRHGVKAEAAAYPFVLDDIANHDLALSDGLNLPVFAPGEWDLVDFMTMRTVIKQMIGIDPGSSMLADYGQTIARWFPHEGQLNVAVPGTAPYDNLATFAGDVRIAAGVHPTPQPVGVYSLEAVYAAWGIKGVRTVLRAAEHPAPIPPISPESQAARSFVDAEDTLIGAGTLPDSAAAGAPALPNPWPTTCA